MHSIFRTPLQPTILPIKIDHQDKLLSLGSCFAVHLGEKLQEAKFDLLLNPFGILYNPMSIADALERMISPTAYSKNDLFQHNGLWHSFDHHGHYSNPIPEVALEEINQRLNLASQQLSVCNRLLITFGTAHVFWHLEKKRTVANCHKLPSQLFERQRLSAHAITARLHSLFSQLRSNNPTIEIILTLSPVRHLRDGFIENNRSKASLSLAIDTLEKMLPFVHYYPAYELLLDDLRDYRFYDTDMIHPNEVAIEYIWSHFQSSMFSEDAKVLLERLERLSKALKHRPFHPKEAAHQKFLQQQLNFLMELQKKYDFLDFSKERKTIELHLMDK